MSDALRREVWDVAVVGAGPAGAAAALRVLGLRPDARVLLLDRADFPRDKACGDGIAPHALQVLAGLDVHDPAADFSPVHRLRLRSPAGATVAGEMRRPAYVIPRRIFDARLVAAARARGAVLHRHTVRRVEQFTDRVELDGAYAARAVVGADGAESAVRRALGVDRNPPGHLAVALRAYAPAPAGTPEQRLMLTAEGWPAYAWSFPIGDGRANVGYGEVLAGAPVSRARLLARLTELLGIPADALQACRAHHLPLSSWRPAHRDGRVLLAGDAASLINPFTGEGIYYAVLSGALAGAAALNGAGAGVVYRRALRRQLGRHLRHTTAAAALAGRPAMADAGVRAAAADQRVFDDLVELGLGQGLLTLRTAGRTAGRATTRAATEASQAALHRVLART
jgi:geranylgeranyl reductase family protein